MKSTGHWANETCKNKPITSEKYNKFIPIININTNIYCMQHFENKIRTDIESMLADLQNILTVQKYATCSER